MLWLHPAAHPKLSRTSSAIRVPAPAAGCRVVRGARALVVLLVDLLDASGSLLGRVRDLVGNNPIVLVGESVMSLMCC